MSPFGEELDIVIDREKDILLQAVRKYKNSYFYLTRPLNVSFKGEVGIHAGGVTREYFHLLMKRLQVPISGLINLFEGQNGHLVPIHNYDVLSGGLFTLAGKMILHSVLNNCVGMKGLSQAVVVYLTNSCHDSCVEHITVEDLPDPVLQNQVLIRI